MKKLVFLLFATFAAVVSASCVSQDKVRMVGVEDLTMVDEYRFEITVRIENRNGSNLAIKSASITLEEQGMELINLSLAGKVVIPRRSDQGLVFPVVWRMSNPEALSSLPEKTRAGRPLMVRGRVTGQAGIFSKSYKIGPMPVEEFLGMLDQENREMIRGFIY